MSVPVVAAIHGRWGLPLLLATVFLTTADNSIVNVAIPSIRATLGASAAEAQLVVAAYLIGYSVLLVLGARLGDRFGHRTVLLIGMAIFALASLACGLSPNSSTLIGARAVQGIGAAVMVPQVFTVIQHTYAGPERARAIGAFTAALAGGAAAGQFLGGAIISADILGSAWRPIFLINVPFGVLMLAVGRQRLPTGRAIRSASIDIPGTIALSITILLFVVPLILGREYGWPLWSWTLLIGSVFGVIAFIAIENSTARRGRSPLLNLGIVRRRPIAWGLAAIAAATMTYAALLFSLALYLQEGLGKSPIYSGSILLAWVIAFGSSGPLTSVVVRRLGRRTAPLAFLLLAGCFAMLVTSTSVLGAAQDMPLVAALALGGFGMGVGMTVVASDLTKAVTSEESGQLSGIMSTNSEVAATAGVALLGTLYLATLEAGRQPTAALLAVATTSGVLAVIAAISAHRSSRTT